MGRTNAKGEIGEAMILADLQRKGYGVAVPFGHDLPFDLILIRRTTGALERVQCRYTESDGRSLDVRCASTSAWVHHTYSADRTTNRCYYVHSSTWSGMSRPKLRLIAAANGQRIGVRPADAFLYPELGAQPRPDQERRLAMLVDPAPE